jgi:hypothetical protein
MKIHLVQESQQPDLLIHCLQRWTQPAWLSNALPKLESEIFWAEPIIDTYIAYTFSKEKVTCEKCLKIM